MAEIKNENDARQAEELLEEDTMPAQEDGMQPGQDEAADIPAPKKDPATTPHWYVVHTYSGYENKVKTNLEKTIENRGLQDLIVEIKVPMQETVKIDARTKKRVTKMEKLYPGYVLVKMIITDESWYVVRNARGVTGFVGPTSKPEPLTDEEVVAMGVERIALKIDIEPGETVKIITPPLENFLATVMEVYPDRQKIKVSVSMFGRETPVELDFVEVRKLVD